MKTNFVFLLLPFILLLSCNNGQEKELKKLSFDGTYIEYDGSVTEDEVNELGQFLIDSDYTDGTEMATKLTKEDGVYIFKMEMLIESVFKDEEFHELIKTYAKQISDEIFDGKEVIIHLCNTEFETKTKISSKSS